MWFSRFLAELLETLNPVLAAVIVVAGGYLGYREALSVGENLTFGAGLGVVFGLVVAALVCGLIANLSLIEQHLALMADDIEEMRARADRDDYDPYLLPGDAIACYDSSVTNIAEVGKVLGIFGLLTILD